MSGKWWEIAGFYWIHGSLAKIVILHFNGYVKSKSWIIWENGCMESYIGLSLFPSSYKDTGQII